MDGYDTESGAYTLRVTCPPTPTFVGNLSCGQTAVGDTTNANNTQTGVNAAPEHWFGFDVPHTGAYVFDTCGSDFDTFLLVFLRTGPSPLTDVGLEVATCDNCGTCGSDAQLTVALTPGSYVVPSPCLHRMQCGHDMSTFHLITM